MKSFKLELRVYDSGSIRWQVCLERLVEHNIVNRWLPPDGERDYWLKAWDNYRIDDDALEVFVLCSGYDALVRCVVLIDNAKPSKANTIRATSSDTKPAFKSFPI